MAQLLAILILCCSSSSVLAQMSKLKEKFIKIENETAHYEAINEQITEKLMEAEEYFNSMLRQKGKKEKSLNKVIQKEVDNLKDLQSSLTKIKIQENAIERDYDLQNFYQKRNQLIITLLEQDIEVLANRRQDQINKICVELDEEVSTPILLRSSISDVSEIDVLKVMLRRKLTSLNNAKNENKKLHEELNYKENLYRLTLNDVHNELENSQGDLKLIKKNVDELQSRLTNATEKVAKMKFELLKQLEENMIHGKKIQELKSNFQEYNSDIACYQKIVSEDFLHIASD